MCPKCVQLRNGVLRNAHTIEVRASDCNAKSSGRPELTFSLSQETEFRRRRIRQTYVECPALIAWAGGLLTTRDHFQLKELATLHVGATNLHQFWGVQRNEAMEEAGFGGLA